MAKEDQRRDTSRGGGDFNSKQTREGEIKLNKMERVCLAGKNDMLH